MRWLVVTISLALAACVSQAPANREAASVEPEPAALVADGRDIAEAQCASCHAVGAYGESPDVRAPVFRSILQRYSADVLEEELIEGIRVSHPMPEFQFNPQGTDALIAYLRSIQEAPAD